MTSDSQVRIYRCNMCKAEVSAYTIDLLCVLVNGHGRDAHPGSYCPWWTPESIIYSSFYSGPDRPELAEQNQAKYPDMKPEYAQRWGTSRNSTRVLVPTAADLKWLKRVKVRW